MGQSRPFETLEEFGKAVRETHVVVGTQSVVKLEEGLHMAVKMVQTIAESGKKVVLIGNGGSAAIASHQAVDLWKNGGIRAMAFNDASLLTCISNDLGYENVFSKPIEMFCDKGDLVIAISSSGKSANIVNGVQAAREKGCSVIGFSGFEPDNPLRVLGNLNFYLPSNRYGTVEVGHLLLIHAIVDEVIDLKKRATRDMSKAQQPAKSPVGARPQPRPRELSV